MKQSDDLSRETLYGLGVGRFSLQVVPPHPLPRMRISLPRHDLLREEMWPITQRRRARSLFLNRVLLGLFA